ncbi:helix-turn-helix transcriptional regulator [Euzebya sp.]|uniref:helix-turn-helix transcriptional regulator n=1 Tax=Euzebya sp. TaxID=1971409 RepID=UPI0035112C8C
MVDRLERLVNLVIALRETRRPLTVEQINSRVAGYGGERDEAWRRMFERDKADLRDLGVPVRTEKVDRFDETLGYRIEPDDYDLPSVSLTPSELTALALSVQLTGLADDAAPALDKLAVDAGVPGEQRAVRRLPLELGLDAPHRAALTEALVERRPVTFGYRKAAGADDSEERRRVEPHALLHWRGRWYLRGHDVDRGADRTFRLDRITDRVRPAGEPGTVVIPDQPPDPVEVVPGASRDAVEAVVRADEETAWAVARRARGSSQPAGEEADGWREFVVRTADPDELIGWLVELGPGVELVGPPALRARLVAHLRAVLDPAAGTTT